MSQLRSSARAFRGLDGAQLPRLAVVPRIRQRVSRVPFAVLVGLVLLGGVSGLLLFNTNMQKSAFLAAELQSEAVMLQARETQLKATMDRLRDPQRLAQEAKKLGMLPPDSPTFLHLGTNQILGDAVAASGVNDFPVNQPRVPRPDALVIPRETVIAAPTKREMAAEERRLERLAERRAERRAERAEQRQAERQAERRAQRQTEGAAGN